MRHPGGLPLACLATHLRSLPYRSVSVSFSGVTLPVFEHYQEGGDSKSGAPFSTNPTQTQDPLISSLFMTLWVLLIFMQLWFWWVLTLAPILWGSASWWDSFYFPGYELTGLARGGEQLAKLKRNYAKAVELLVELASLQVEGHS